MRMLLCAALLTGIVYGQTFTAGPLIWVSDTNLFESCIADSAGFTPNSEVEPCLAINPTNPSNLIGVWQQDRYADGGARGIVAGVSLDAGATWQSVLLPGVSLCDGGEFQRASDPWVSFGPDGAAHVSVLAFDPNGGPEVILALRSTDGGLTWSGPVMVSGIFGTNDKETITADPTDSNLVYAVWDRLEPFRGDENSFAGPTIFTRSTDSGLTWELPRAIMKPKKFQQTLGNQILVRPTDGALLNFATYIRARKTGKARNSVTMQMSLDKGVTWSKPKRVLKTQPHSAFDGAGVFDPKSHAELRTGDVLPAFAVDPVSGAFYAAWQDSRFSDNGMDEIAFAQSADGRKWSKPIQINLTPAVGPGPNRQAFNPALAVAADGTICVTYYDFRFNDRNETPPLSTDVWAAFRAPATTNWGNEVRLTGVSFDFLQAPNARGYFLGDYQGLATDGNDFVALFAVSNAEDPGHIVLRRLARAP